jgi:hypothetical protein
LKIVKQEKKRIDKSFEEYYSQYVDYKEIGKGEEN